MAFRVDSLNTFGQVAGMKHTTSLVFSSLHRRSIFLVLVGLFAVQTFLTYTSGTRVKNSEAVFDARAERGEQLYREFNCTACHQLYGLGGYMGPDLTNVTSAVGKGPDLARGIILMGTQRMPMLGLTKDEADDVVAFLEAVAATGTYPIRRMDLSPWGTYREMHTNGR